MRSWCVALGIAGLVVVTGAAAGALLLLRGGISARPEPSAAEASIARTLRGWAIPSSARALANPVPESAGTLSDGRAHFADHCASCHANDGSGDTKLGRSLSPRAPDLRLPATQQLTDGELFYIIENGVRLTGMPAWGGAGDPEASWNLVRFIRHLPQLTEEERVEMEGLNPRSPGEWRALQEDTEFLRGGPVPSEGSSGHEHSH
jgi:mono/diheme cytochrome c family protein